MYCSCFIHITISYNPSNTRHLALSKGSRAGLRRSPSFSQSFRVTFLDAPAGKFTCVADAAPGGLVTPVTRSWSTLERSDGLVSPFGGDEHKS